MSVSGGTVSTAAKVLEQYISGEVAEANAQPQLLHLHQSDPRAVLAALADKANNVVCNADAGTAATQAGAVLINVARFLDQNASSETKAPKASAKGGAGNKSVSRALLDHVLLLTGTRNRAAKETAVRAQGCALVADLAVKSPDHVAAKDKLLEFALDRVPSIRERAVQGLATFAGSLDVDQALSARLGDPYTTVRVATVRSMRVNGITAPALTSRIDDVESSVRAELFHTLAQQPTAVSAFGPAALSRLVAGLADRSASVRNAAGLAVDAWREQLSGVAHLLQRCDIVEDEALGNAVARELAARFKDDSAVAARRFLSEGLTAAGSIRTPGAGGTSTPTEGLCAAMLTRHAIAVMSEEERDERVDVPLLLQRTTEALGAASSRQHGGLILRQLLHIVALVDFGDETARRRAERLGEAVLQRAPLTKVSSSSPSSAEFGMADLGILILRKCNGLGIGRGFQPRTSKHHALEAQCSTRAVLIISDLCQPLQGAAESEGSGDDEQGEGGQFATRLSMRLQELNNAIDERLQRRSSFAAQKKQAVAKEEFIQAQRLKEATVKNDAELDKLQKEHAVLKAERDDILMRVLAIIRALLRWSNSDMQRDPALFRTLNQIIAPVVALPALSEDVEVAAVTAICLFCVRDGGTAKSHWGLLLQLLRSVRPDDNSGTRSAADRRLFRARAAVAARTMADCALVHSGGSLDRDEILSAANALSVVPFPERHIVVEPLCSWLLGLGHVFFEEHLREPVLEVQWALGWMLVEAFKQHGRHFEEDDDFDDAASAIAGNSRAPQAHVAAAAKVARGRGASWVGSKPAAGNASVGGDEGEDEVDEEDGAEEQQTSSKMLQFFNLVPKLPGKHASPMLSLAVESIAESGLWRRGVLLPRIVGGRPRWLRGFSWPQLFAFAHERLPAEMRFRLWRCALQLCVSDPELAPLAEVPAALVKVMKEAPAGTAALLREAVALGADASALSPLLSRLPPSTDKSFRPRGESLLLPRAEAKAAEQEHRAALAELDIDIDVWAPAEVQVPDLVPPHLRRFGGQKGEAGRKRSNAENAGPIVPPTAFPKEAKQSFAEASAAPEATKRRRCANKTKDTNYDARLPLRDLGDIE
mmetsp:Transcript_110626/g.277121  ORF Transcript_110626/g.277121 Transcript_110626/m.277121 type:complete len:1107 (+) Transcript_110626:142-3462(+)